MRKVMVLEDESSIRSFIVINLRRAGYEVVEAETGEEALDKLHENPDTLVALLDVIENGRLVASEEEVTDKTELDASGLKVLPGLVDIHSHGAVRHDFSDADVDGLKVILQYERSQGVTSYCPTSMTLPKEELLKTAKPILFNTEMVQAILNGLKTTTRRYATLQQQIHPASSCRA